MSEREMSNEADENTKPYFEKSFSELLVGDVYDKIVTTPSQVRKDAKIGEAIEEMLENPLSRKVYVTDEDGKYVGTVNTETLLRLLGYRVGVRDHSNLSFLHFWRDVLKEDVIAIMVKGRTVTKETKLTRAMDIMLDDHLNDLPVVDAEGRLVGELISLEIFIEGKRLFKESN